MKKTVVWHAFVILTRSRWLRAGISRWGPDCGRCPTPGPNPPAVSPARFEDFPAFRETFLAVFTDPTYNAALREVGNLIFEMALEYRGHWPHHPEGVIRSELRALVADLRVIQGHLASLADPANSSPGTAREQSHLAVAGRIAEDVQHAADTLELGPEAQV